MSEPRPPWFPGQFGRSDGEAALFTGDPYADDPAAAEPYARAALPGQATNPYGEVPAPPPSAPDAGSWLADAGAAAGARRPGDDAGADVGGRGPADDGGADAGGRGPRDDGGAGVDGGGAAPLAGATAGPTAGYEDFYEPGAVPRSHLRRPGRRSGSGRRHGPRGERSGRKVRRLGGAAGADAADAAASITVVPGGTAGRGAATATGGAGSGASPSTVAGSRRTLGGSAGNARPASPRRRRTAAWFAVLAVVGLGVVVGTQVARDAAPPTADPAPTVSPTASRTPGPTPDPLPSPTVVAPPGEVAVGTTVSEGPFDVEVLGVSTGLSELAGATAAATAEGEFVVVRLRVTATQPGPSYFLDIDQRLLDASGGGHGPDVRAAMAVDGNRLWFAELDEGESAEGVVVFDVPPGTVPATLEVHGSDEGPGARVDLPTS